MGTVIRVLCDVLNLYRVALGQLVNMDKSEVCFGKDVLDVVRDEVTDFVRVKQVECHEKYLGLSTFASKFVHVIPSYAMAFFKLSKKLMKDLHRLIADFLWGSKKGKSKMNWSKWNEMCNSKEEGGLGFRDLGRFN
ncbi:hypothetical protein UlMin_016573 [Ulmus minor]